MGKNQNELRKQTDAAKPRKRVRLQSSRGECYLDDLEAAVVVDGLGQLLRAGCYVSLYTNRDGNVFAVAVLHDDLEGKTKQWVSEESDFTNLCSAVLEALRA